MEYESEEGKVEPLADLPEDEGKNRHSSSQLHRLCHESTTIDGGRSTGTACVGEVSNSQPLQMHEGAFVVNGAGKGGVYPSCEYRRRRMQMNL